MRLLFWASVFLIVYGSLYPFEFSFSGLGAVDFGAFLTNWSLVSGRSDFLAISDCSCRTAFSAF